MPYWSTVVLLAGLMGSAGIAGEFRYMHLCRQVDVVRLSESGVRLVGSGICRVGLMGWGDNWAVPLKEGFRMPACKS